MKNNFNKMAKEIGIPVKYLSGKNIQLSKKEEKIFKEFYKKNFIDPLENTIDKVLNKAFKGKI
jgi:phage portal protein BeeE